MSKDFHRFSLLEMTLPSTFFITKQAYCLYIYIYYGQRFSSFFSSRNDITQSLFITKQAYFLYIYIYIYIYIYLYKMSKDFHRFSLEFFSSAPAVGFSLKSERQEIFSDLNISYEYPTWFSQYRGLDCLNSISDTHFPGLFSMPLETAPTTSTTMISSSLLCSTVFQLSSKIQVFIYLFAFFYFHSVVCRNGEIHWLKSSFLLVD